MPGPKMNVLAGLVAALGVFVTGVVAESGGKSFTLRKVSDMKRRGMLTESSSQRPGYQDS